MRALFDELLRRRARRSGRHGRPRTGGGRRRSSSGLRDRAGRGPRLIRVLRGFWSSALVASSSSRIGAIAQEGPGDGDALFLTARQLRALGADGRVAAGADQVGDLGVSAACQISASLGVGVDVADVVPDRGVEDHDVLRHDREGAAQGADRSSSMGVPPMVIARPSRRKAATAATGPSSCPSPSPPRWPRPAAREGHVSPSNSGWSGYRKSDILEPDVAAGVEIGRGAGRVGDRWVSR